MPHAINITSVFLPSKPKIKSHESAELVGDLGAFAYYMYFTTAHLPNLSDSSLNKIDIFPRPP